MDEVTKALLRIIDTEGPLMLTEEKTRRDGEYIRLGQNTALAAEKRGLVTTAPKPLCDYAIVASITDKGRAALAAS